MNVLPEEKKTLDETQTGDLRSVRDIRKCGIEYGTKFRGYNSWRIKVVSVSISPSGFLLLVKKRYYVSYTAVIKLDILYKAISELKLETDLICEHSCYNSHNDFLVVYGKDLIEKKLFFVDVKDEMSLYRSVSISQECRSLVCHSANLYLIDKDSVYIYSFDGEFIKTLYKEKNVSGAFLAIAVSNDGSMIYILNDREELSSINSSGYNLFKLKIPEIDRFFSWSTDQLVCVDDQGNVFILVEQSASSNLIKIIQVSPNGQKCYGVLFQFDGHINYDRIVFDSSRCALVLVGGKKEKDILVLTLH